MSKITLDIPEENIPLFLEITGAMGIDKEHMTIKDSLPEWHKNILKDRMEDYKAGKTSLTSWDDFESELDNEDKVNEV